MRLCSKTVTPVAENLNIYPWILGGGNGNSLQYSCWDYTMDGGALQATVHGVAKNRT